MAIRVECTCGAKLNVSEGAAGKTLTCPGCGGPFQVDASPQVLPSPVGSPPVTEPSAFNELVALMADEVQPRHDDVPILARRTVYETHRRSHVTVTARTGKALNPFGLASFLFGLIGLLVCWVPYFNLMAIPILAIGLGLGAMGVLTAQIGKQSGLEWPLSGAGLCVLGLVASLVVTGSAESARQQEAARLAASFRESTRLARVDREEEIAAQARRQARDDAQSLAARQARIALEQEQQREALQRRQEQEEARLKAQETALKAPRDDPNAREQTRLREAQEAARLQRVQDDIDNRRRETLAAQEAELRALKGSRRKAVTRLADAGHLMVEGETAKALAIYLAIVKDYPDLVESDVARAKVRDLDPSRKAEPAYQARFAKVDPARRQRDIERQLDERKAEIARKAKIAQAGRNQAAALAPAAASAASGVTAENQRVLETNAAKLQAIMRDGQPR